MTRGRKLPGMMRLGLLALVLLPAAAWADGVLPILSVNDAQSTLEIAPYCEYLLDGTHALTSLGRLLPLTLREEDIACRYGGEEFAVILQHTDLATALEAAERIRSRFAQTPFFPTKERTVRLTVSVGAAQLRADDDAAAVLSRADQALYQAKRSGRDRVCSA